MDPLTDLLAGVRARTAAFCQAVLDPPWALRIADGAAIALVTTLRGHAWISLDASEPTLMHQGDVAIIKGPHPYTVGDDPGTAPGLVVSPGNRLTTVEGVDVTDETVRAWGIARPDGAGTTIMASGTYQVAGDVTGRLLHALPTLVLVPADNVQGPVMALLADEVGRDGPGQQILLDRLLDMALVATLRAWFTQPGAVAPGWYRAHDDPVAGPALRLMHDDPAHRWTVDSLAEKVGCSRAAFARRFTTVVGVPPIAYLTDWRITLAADLLRTSDLTIDAIAHRVGYANAFALSVAFSRVRGLAPSHYRADATATGPRQAAVTGIGPGR